MMENISADRQLPETSFELSHHNQDKVIISYGPKNGFLLRGDAFDKQLHLIESLNNVFTNGFTQQDEISVLASLPYIKRYYPDFICASNTYCNRNELTGLEYEQFSAGTYGYIYLIDTSEKNIQSIPLCEENLLNKQFVAGYTEEINEGVDYAIISKVDPRCIIGAIPSAFVAFALGINEKSFITNPAYKKTVNCEKIKETIGEKFFLLTRDRLRHPDLPLSEVYQRYLQAEERSNQQACLASSFQNRRSVIFFQSNQDEVPFFPETQKSLGL